MRGDSGSTAASAVVPPTVLKQQYRCPAVVVPLGLISGSTDLVQHGYRLDSRMSFLVLGCAAVEAAVAAVVPPVSGSTAATTATSAAHTLFLSPVLPLFLLLSVSSVVPLVVAVVPLLPIVVPLYAGWRGG